MKTAALIQSNYIRKQELMDQPMILTIADVTLEDSRQRKQQGVLWFMETHKGLGLNNTKVKVLEAAYGPDTEAWEGKRVRLVYDPTVKMGDVVTGGIRLETPKGLPTVPAAPPGAPPPPVWDPVGQVWRTQPVPAAAPAGRPPPPVWDEASQSWVTSAPPSVAPATPAAADGFGPPPPTIAQRVADASKPFDDEVAF